MRQMELTKKITAYVVVITIVFMMLFSAFYIGNHSGHYCDGQDCPVCAVLEQCSETLRVISTAVIFVCITLSMFSFLLFYFNSETENFYNNSLISKKVRMNN